MRGFVLNREFDAAMLTIATVLRSGGIYDDTWVARLAAQCRRHAPPHRFLCLTDVGVTPALAPGVVDAKLPLLRGWPGWWSKMEALALPGPVLYLDLDTLILGDLGDILAAAALHDLIMLRDFYRHDGLGSGVMAWSRAARLPRCVLDRFAAQPHDWMTRCAARGDQGAIEDIVGGVWHIPRWQDLYPGQIVSYKADRCEAGPPPDARLMCWHGKPKPTDLPASSWARQAWEAAA